jgi:HAD superfamily hydrolase (TIGR01484 family)
MPCAYDLRAIDLDGTLLEPAGRVREGEVAAIERAREAGLVVTVCTGRGLVECRAILDAIQQEEPVVIASGAILASPVSGATIHRFPMDLALVERLAVCMLAHDHAVLVLKDAAEVGYDYLVVSPRGVRAVSPVTLWWFEQLKVRVRFAASLEEDEHPEHTVRVAVCGMRRETERVAREIRAEFDRQITVHHFGAVVPEGDPDDPDDQVVILETFDPRVNKWTAIEWFARQRGLDAGRIATIGNDVNDIVMLERSALGVAMGNAIPDAKAVANRVTVDNDAGGVAHAIDRILAGEW